MSAFSVVSVASPFSFWRGGEPVWSCLALLRNENNFLLLQTEFSSVEGRLDLMGHNLFEVLNQFTRYPLQLSMMPGSIYCLGSKILLYLLDSLPLSP